MALISSAMSVSNHKPLRTTARGGLCKDPGFLGCTVFLILGIIVCILSSIPLIVCSAYGDQLVVGLAEDLKIAGAGFLIFGLLVVVFGIIGMIYMADRGRRKKEEILDYILEENEEVGYPRTIAFTNPMFGNAEQGFQSLREKKLKDIPL